MGEVQNVVRITTDVVGTQYDSEVLSRSVGWCICALMHGDRIRTTSFVLRISCSSPPGFSPTPLNSEVPLMLSDMVLPVLVAAVLGAAVARSIVAEADAHRLELPDRWFGPVCAECGSNLGPVLAACRQHEHTQRRTNVVVLVTAVVLSGLIPAAVPSLWLVPAYLVFVWAMILLTVTDLDTKLIPNRILGPATLIGIVLLLAGHLVDPSGGSLGDAAIGGASYFVVMFILALIVKGGLGFGDVKLAFMIGVFSGYVSLGYVLVAGIGSFLIGGVVAVFLLITRRQGRKDAIPFGPFMTTAAVLALFFGQSIIDWYLR